MWCFCLSTLISKIIRRKQKKERKQKKKEFKSLPNAHSLFNVCGSNFIAKTNNKLCNLFDVDEILGVFTFRVDYFGATSNLQGLFFLHHLLVMNQIPERRRSKV